MTHGMLNIRIHDKSPNAVKRLPEHVLRAQRYAWCCDGYMMTYGNSMNAGPSVEEMDFRDQLEMENEGRIAAFKRQTNMLELFEPETKKQKKAQKKSASDMHDCTIEASDMSEGSLILELCIPLAGFVALYIARMYAKERSDQREFDARMRVIEAVDRQLVKGDLPKETKKRLLEHMIKGIGAFDARIVEQMTVEIGGQKLSVGSEIDRLPRKKKKDRSR